MAKKDARFESLGKHSVSFLQDIEIVRDRETGVCYMWATSGYGLAVTPLLNADGRPVVDRTVSTLR